jgi:hypothetical protein
MPWAATGFSVTQEPNGPPWFVSGQIAMLAVDLGVPIILLLGVLVILRAIKNAPIGHEDENGFRVDPTSARDSKRSPAAPFIVP